MLTAVSSESAGDGETPQQSSRRRDRLRSDAQTRAAKLTVRQWGVGVLALALAASAAFGGLDEAVAEQQTVLPGEPASAEPFELTVTRAVHAVELTEVTGASSHGRFLLVFAELVNTDDEPIPADVLVDTVRLLDVDGLAHDLGEATDSADVPPQVLNATDSTPLGVVGPQMSYSVAFLWDQSDAVAVPEELTIELYSHQWRRSSLDNRWGWVEPTALATARMPVEAWQPPTTDDADDDADDDAAFGDTAADAPADDATAKAATGAER